MAGKTGLTLVEVIRPPEGETIELTAVVIVGSVVGASAPAQFGLIGALVAGAANRRNSGGRVRGSQYVVLTNQRLIFVAVNQFTGWPEPHITAEFPRAGLAATLDKRGLMFNKVVITTAGADRGLRLQFREQAKAFAIVQSLTTAPAA